MAATHHLHPSLLWAAVAAAHRKTQQATLTGLRAVLVVAVRKEQPSRSHRAARAQQDKALLVVLVMLVVVSTTLVAAVVALVRWGHQTAEHLAALAVLESCP